MQAIGLGAFAEMVAIRLMLSLLILQLIRAAIQAGNVGLDIMGRVRDRFHIFELLCWIRDPANQGRISHELYRKFRDDYFLNW